MQAYKIIFAGTPDFSVAPLKALIQSQHEVVAVYSQPDRPKGRGRKLLPTAVKEVAIENNIPVYQPVNFKNTADQEQLKSLAADFMVVVAYGLILPKVILTAPKNGCLNIHASVLPRWRGAAPIQRAIEAGDKESGVTIMQMDAGLDTGDMLYKLNCDIAEDDSSSILHDKLSVLGAKGIIHTLEHYTQLEHYKQDEKLVTYAHKITKDEAKINWAESAINILRKIKAFNPWPVAYYGEDNHRIRIWDARLSDSSMKNHKPGEILNISKDGIDVATINGVITLLKLQLPGGKILDVKDILNSRKNEFVVGEVL